MRGKGRVMAFDSRKLVPCNIHSDDPELIFARVMKSLFRDNFPRPKGRKEGRKQDRLGWCNAITSLSPYSGK